MNVIRVTSLPMSPDKPARLLISISDAHLAIVNRKFPNIPDIFFSNITDEYYHYCEMRNATRRDAISFIPMLALIGRTALMSEILGQASIQEVPNEPKKRML